MDMVATYNETTLASNDPRKDLPAGFYTMKSLVSCSLQEDLCKSTKSWMASDWKSKKIFSFSFEMAITCSPQIMGTQLKLPII